MILSLQLLHLPFVVTVPDAKARREDHKNGEGDDDGYDEGHSGRDMGASHIECHCVSSIECWSGVSSVGVKYRVSEWSIECRVSVSV